MPCVPLNTQYVSRCCNDHVSYNVKKSCVNAVNTYVDYAKKYVDYAKTVVILVKTVLCSSSIRTGYRRGGLSGTGHVGLAAGDLHLDRRRGGLGPGASRGCGAGSRGGPAGGELERGAGTTAQGNYVAKGAQPSRRREGALQLPLSGVACPCSACTRKLRTRHQSKNSRWPYSEQ